MTFAGNQHNISILRKRNGCADGLAPVNDAESLPAGLLSVKSGFHVM